MLLYVLRTVPILYLLFTVIKLLTTVISVGKVKKPVFNEIRAVSCGKNWIILTSTYFVAPFCYSLLLN